MSALGIPSKAIDHLRSLGFVNNRHYPVNPGEVYYCFLWAPSEEDKELSVTLGPNQQDNPSLKCYLVKPSARWAGDPPALVSFRSWDEVLSPSFDTVLAKVVRNARAALAAEKAELERKRRLEGRRISAAKAFADEVRALMGQVVNINKHDLSGTIAGHPAAIVFNEIEDVELESIDCIMISDIEVGKACNGDPVALAHRVRAFINAVREASLPWTNAS